MRLPAKRIVRIILTAGHASVGNNIPFSRAPAPIARGRRDALGLRSQARRPKHKRAVRAARDETTQQNSIETTRSQFPLLPRKKLGFATKWPVRFRVQRHRTQPPTPRDFLFPSSRSLVRSDRTGMEAHTSDERAQGDAGRDRLAAVVGVVLREVRVPCVVVKHEPAGCGGRSDSNAWGMGVHAAKVWMWTYARFAL